MSLNLILSVVVLSSVITSGLFIKSRIFGESQRIDFFRYLLYPFLCVLCILSLYIFVSAIVRKKNGCIVSGISVALLVLVGILVYYVDLCVAKMELYHPDICAAEPAVPILKILDKGFRDYVSKKGLFPKASTWCDVLRGAGIDVNNFRHPERPNEKCSFAYNGNLDNLPNIAIPVDTVLLIECAGEWNNVVFGESDLTQDRTGHGRLVLFVDGKIGMWWSMDKYFRDMVTEDRINRKPSWKPSK